MLLKRYPSLRLLDLCPMSSSVAERVISNMYIISHTVIMRQMLFTVTWFYSSSPLLALQFFKSNLTSLMDCKFRDESGEKHVYILAESKRAFLGSIWIGLNTNYGFFFQEDIFHFIIPVSSNVCVIRICERCWLV